MRSREEIEKEMQELSVFAVDYDTERQSNDACVAAGAFDALHWVLGRSKNSVSDNLKSV